MGGIEEQHQEHNTQRVAEATNTASQVIFTEVRQSPLRSSYVIIVEVTTKVWPQRYTPSSDHKGQLKISTKNQEVI